MALIRLETAADVGPIRELLEEVFPGQGEADLVEALRREGDLVLSLVAERDGHVIGNVVLSRLLIEGDGDPSPAVALAPLAVYPEYQHRGIATLLLREAHACLAYMGERLSVVLGEPDYYGKFGYSHRRAARFDSVYQSPFLLALSFGEAPWEGRLVYPPAFDALTDDAPLQADGRV